LTFTYVGIDLAASPKRCTGFAIIENNTVTRVTCLYSNTDIIRTIEDVCRDSLCVIAIDAPFDLPSYGYRRVDLEMKRRGLRVLPPSLGPMKILTIRASFISRYIKQLAFQVIETHPRSALIASRCSDLTQLLYTLNVHSSRIDIDKLSKDLVDAIICAVVALCYIKGCAEPVKAEDGVIWILTPIC